MYSDKLEELNKKNSDNKEYSLGDVLLLDHYEKKLLDLGWSKELIKKLSPNYYLN